MLTIYRHHHAGCKFKARRAKCSCPIWVQGTLNGEKIRQSFDPTSWEAAGKRARDWEIADKKNDLSIKAAAERFIADLNSRGLSPDTVRKFKRLKDELVDAFGTISIAASTTDDVARFREEWDFKPSTARKKLERPRSSFRFCTDRKWIPDNPGSPLKAPKEIAIEKKPYDAAEEIYGEKNRERRIAAFVSVLRWTGLRIRDVVQLKRLMVSEEYITLRTHKNGKPVQLPLHPDVKALLLKMPAGEHYFWSGEDNPKSCVGDWQRTLRKLSALSGVHIHAPSCCSI